MKERIVLHMIVGFVVVWTPLFGIVHELGHVIPGVLLGAEVQYITWTTSHLIPLHPVALMAGPIVEVLFVYLLGKKWPGFDTTYIIFFPFIMVDGLDWAAAKTLGFDGEVLFLMFTAIMVVLSIRRVIYVRSADT